MTTTEAPQHMLSYPDETGDQRVMWNTGVQDEIDAAKETFNRLRGKGYAAYTVDDDGESGEVIRQFDPMAGRIIMTRPNAGG